MKTLFSLLLTVALFSALAFAQGAPQGSAPAGSMIVAMPLGQLNSTAQRTIEDLQRVRVDKWKTDNQTKSQTRDNIAAIQKNLQAALPGLVQAAQANPASVGAAVKLYRNVNVVYDVLASVAESAGAFGAKEDYQALGSDLANLDNIRRNMGHQVEQMASAQDAAYTRLVNQQKAQQAAAAAAPPKKTIVDDTEPVKKTAKSKKKKTASESSTTSQPQ